jgi:hypothetical protein
LEALWKRFGSALEALWKRFGSALETLWKRFGNALEEIWKRFGSFSLIDTAAITREYLGLFGAEGRSDLKGVTV